MSRRSPRGDAARCTARPCLGHVVIAGTAEHDITAEGILASDTDLVLVRFNEDGSIAESFGDLGVVHHNLHPIRPRRECVQGQTLRS